MPISKITSPITLPLTITEDEDDREGDGDVEVDHANSLTRQLAETAIGVREMNKPLSMSLLDLDLHAHNIIILPRSCTPSTPISLAF